MADFEKLLIGKIILSGEIKNVIDRKIHKDMFFDDRNKKVFSHIVNYYQKYGQIPPVEVIDQEFPSYKVEFVKEPADYCIDKILENYIRNKGSDILLKHAKKLTDDPYQGLEKLRSEFNVLGIESTPTQDTNYIESAERRKELYLNLKEMKGIDGLPTPWEVLNECTMGIHPEDFIVVVARPKIGKTWMLTILAEHLWNTNQKILFVSNEMSTFQIGRRFDAIHFKLPYQELRSGLLADAHEQRYVEGLNKLIEEGKDPVWIVGDVGGVSSISAKIDEHQPDVVLIDGMYLLQDDHRSSNRWERITNISRDLKLLTKRKKVPILATTQFNREADEAKVKMTDVNLSMLGFSDSIGQDADVVLGLFTNKDMKSNKELMVRTLAIREGEPKDFILTWDFHKMQFDVIHVNDESEVIQDNEIEDEDLDF